MTKVSIVIPVYNQSKITIDCLNSLIKFTPQDYGDIQYEVIVVDDGSKEPIYKIVSKLFPSFKIIKNDTNLGFPAAVNAGIKESKFDNILLLNNDIIIKSPDWLKIMCGYLDKCDLIAPAFGKFNKNWEYLPGELTTATDYNNFANKNIGFYYPIGWALLIKRQVFDKIGAFDTAFNLGFFDDLHFAYRAKMAGFSFGLAEEMKINTPSAKIKHLYHTTFKSSGINITKQYEKNRKIFLDLIK